MYTRCMSDDGCGDTEKHPAPAPGPVPAGVGEPPQSVPAPPTAPQDASPQPPHGFYNPLAVPPASWQPGSADTQRFPRRLAVPVTALIALVLGGVIGGAIGVHAVSRTIAAPTVPAAAAPTPAALELSPDEAKANVCKALADNYPALVHVTQEKKKYNSSPWDDPGFLHALSNEHRVLTAMVTDIENALNSGPVPPELRSATQEYVAAVRAVDISDQQHASNKQLGGVGRFYNSVNKRPRELCGI